jgi:hypothetical protein
VGGSTEEEASEKEMSTEDEEACIGWLYVLSILSAIAVIIILTFTKAI